MTTTTLRIGVVGCGNISVAYMRNAALFSGVRITACADVNAAATTRRAAEFGLRALEVDALIADPAIDLVLNLTVPAAHFDISVQALAAGKHVFTEKPLATTANVLSLLEFECGASVTFGASCDVFRHSNPPIELHGTNGSLRLPDPDTFGGVVAVSAGETGMAQVIAGSTAQPRELREDEAARLLA